MKICKLSVALAAIVLPGVAFSQPGTTCAQAITIQSNSSVNGDSCTSGNPIGALGPLPSPHNDVIYSFVAQSANATITVPAASYDYGVFLTSGCAGTTPAPSQATTGPSPGGSFPVSGLTNGQTYYIIVSGNPSVDTPACGTYSLTVTGILPVELQSFSVD